MQFGLEIDMVSVHDAQRRRKVSESHTLIVPSSLASGSLETPFHMCGCGWDASTATLDIGIVVVVGAT